MRGGNALLCEAGGGCDIVQASRYATILWVPTALWGRLPLFVAVGALAALGFTARRWRWTFLLAAAGAHSIYLTAISLFLVAGRRVLFAWPPSP